MYIAILGRQPALGIAELERLFSDVRWFSASSALFDAKQFNVEKVGGTQKAGRVILKLPRGDWRQTSLKIVQHYQKNWLTSDAKITLGLSAYGFDVSPRDVQKTGLILKSKLKEKGVSLRLVPNQEAILSSATSHHNKLGLSANKIELLVVKATNGRIIVAESTGAQNITALAARDQGRPKRDAFVGMLPPKLAQIMINLAPADGRILDPFCGTGVILQEAALLGHPVYGTDLVQKMVDFSQTNLKWLAESHNLPIDLTLAEGDATKAAWKQPIDAVVTETYLGQPFSAPPSPSKLTEVRGNCNHIVSEFLKNLAKQIKPGTPLCVAIPAWRDGNGDFTHLPLLSQIEELGYTQVEFMTVRPDQLLYYREDQIVARELLVLTKR
jgi:tRNA G10  N-methylase Trm11